MIQVVVKYYYVFLVLLLMTKSVNGAWVSYNFTEVSPFDGLTRNLRLSVPDDFRYVRGILVNFNASSGDTRAEYLQAYFEEFLRLHQFAFIGTEGFAQASANSNESALRAYTNSIASFATQSGRVEIHHAPLVLQTASAGNGPQHIVLRTNATHVIAYSVGSGSFGDVPPTIAAPQIMEIPAILWAGDNDVSGLANKMESFVATNRASGLRGAYAVLQGTTHAQSILLHNIGIANLHEAIALSYPTNQSALNPPVTLARVAEADGWLINTNTIRSVFATVTNYAAYVGDKTKAHWVLNKNMAYVYRAFATHSPPISLSVPGDETEVNPGSSITVTVVDAAFTGWTNMAIFSFSTNLANFTSGTATVTLNNVTSGLYVFSAIGTRGGTNVTTKPKMVLVRKTVAPSFPYIWYASTNGGISAVGNIATPADLQTLLNRTTTVLPGDYIHLRNGNYTHIPQATNCATCDDPGFIFRVTVAGNSSAYTTIQSHPGELASIDGGNWVHAYGTTRRTWQIGSSGSTTLGAWTITKNIRVYSSATETRTSTETDPDFQTFPRDLFRSGGVKSYAPNVKVINCIFHDTTTGLESFGTSSSPNEYYGNLSFNNGWRGINQLHGHGFYLQNSLAGSTKTLSTNITVNNFDNGSNISGSSDSELYHFRVWGNTFINNRLLLGGRSGTPQGDNQIHNNFTFNADLGFLYHLSPNSIDIQVNNNYVGGGIVQGGMWDTAVFTNNTVIHTKSGQLFILLTSPFCNVPTGWTVDRNTYKVTNAGDQLFRDEGCTQAPGNPYYTLAGWRTHTGWEMNSTVTAPLPTTNMTVLQPNLYDTNRAHLLVYNWALSNNVMVSLSTLGWGATASVRVRNAQDYWGDIKTNTLPGNNILLPMQASAHTVALPYGSTTASGSPSFPKFGAFILERLETATATPTNTLTIASSNPASGVAITATTDLNGNGNGTTSFARDYLQSTAVTLVAPATASGKNFSKWQRNGVDYLFNATLNYTVDANVTLTAVYIEPPTTTWQFNIASSDPGSGVAITVTPNDNAALGNGVTPFTRTYNDGVDITFTAPTTAGGNVFQQWTRVVGGTVTANPAMMLTAKSGNQDTYTAVYITPPTDTNDLAVQVLNGPDSTIDIMPLDNYGNGSGETPLVRNYNSGSAATLTAPNLAIYGYNFVEWQDENFLVIGSTTNITLIVPTNNPIFTARAVYNTNAPIPGDHLGKAGNRRRGVR